MSSIAWAATSDKVGHAFRNRRQPALCGARPWPPRYDWPVVRRCLACTRLESEVPIGR